EDTRRAACLASIYIGTRHNILYLWEQESVIDFKSMQDDTSSDDTPPAELLNHIITSARHLWLGRNDVNIDMPLQLLLQQLRMDIFEADQFLQSAKKLITTIWSQKPAPTCESEPQDMPRAVSHVEDLESEEETDSPLAMKSDEET